MDDSKVKSNPEFDNHELVRFFEDKATGLKGILAIHSTKRGPAVGGTRYFHYGSEEEALEDVLRLSHAMTYKCIMADVPFGGGKCVLFAPPGDQSKSKEYLAAYGKFLNEYSTKFFTGEDVGMSQEDVEVLIKVTPNIIGSLARAGDPSPWASLSTFYAIKGVLKFLYGNDSVKGKKVNIKGLGKVGMELARLLDQEEAILFVSDIRQERVALALKNFKNVTAYDPKDYASIECDIFAPCALGKDITPEVAKNIPVKIVCGGANNQLEGDKEGITLFDRGITFIPDYIANGGGLINVVAELAPGGYDQANVTQKCENIEKIVMDLLTESKATKTAPNIVADNMSRRILTSEKSPVYASANK